MSGIPGVASSEASSGSNYAKIQTGIMDLTSEQSVIDVRRFPHQAELTSLKLTTHTQSPFWRPLALKPLTSFRTSVLVWFAERQRLGLLLSMYSYDWSE